MKRRGHVHSSHAASHCKVNEEAKELLGEPLMNTPEKSGLLNEVAGFLELADLQYEVEADDNSIYLGLGLDTGNYRMMLSISDDSDLRRVLLYLSLPLNAPEAKRFAALDVINRINFDLATGCFEMDPADGKIRFRSGFSLGDATVTADMFNALLGNCVNVIDTYVPKIMSVLFGNFTPEDALAVDKTKNDGITIQ
jgi:hypothetical protein